MGATAFLIWLCCYFKIGRGGGGMQCSEPQWYNSINNDYDDADDKQLLI